MQSDGFDWAEYYRACEGRGPNPFWKRVEPYLPPSGRALDLGAGNGSGTRFLLERGFEVVAVEAQPEGVAMIKALCPEAEILPIRFEDLTLELAGFDVVMGVFSFFFVAPESFARFWAEVVGAVRPGGILGGQFLGPKDDWVARGYSTQSVAEIDELFAGFDFLIREEHDRDGETLLGTPKHWHIHHVLARKREDGYAPPSELQ